MSGTVKEAPGQAETPFLELHKKFLQDTPPPGAVRGLAEAALERFSTLGFPHRKHEMYTFVGTQDLVGQAFELSGEGATPEQEFLRAQVVPGCENSVLVLVDGQYRADLSDTSALAGSIGVVPFAEALSDPGLQNYFKDAIDEENDVFAALNAAFMADGVAITLKEKAAPEVPLQVLCVSTGSTGGPVLNQPRVLIRVQPLAELKLITSFCGERPNYFVNAVMDVLVQEGGQVSAAQVQRDPFEAWHFCKTRVTLAGDSRFFTVGASYGSRLVRHHYDARLKAPGAELSLNAVSVLGGQEQVHQFVRIHHEVPHCTSHQLFKNIVDGKSRVSVDGTVIVCTGAQLTYSDQLINNLMLSDEAHADNKPNLMIFADDVKCTHGATVGQVSPDQMFYLKTRGLSEKTAKELLTKSFAASVIDTVRFPAVAAELKKSLLKKLEA
jgi:Fe-S cluster assembly protein SufD